MNVMVERCRESEVEEERERENEHTFVLCDNADAVSL